LVHRLLHVGLGPLGQQIERDLLERSLARTVAAVDSAPALAGRALAELAPGADARVRILPSLAQVSSWRELDAALLTTSSELPACMPLLRELLGHGLAVVSTCEELLFPWLRHPELALELEQLARERGARLLGTGVNPGFVMDALPVFASAVCKSVRAVRVARIQDAGSRRVPFQRKIGAGLSLPEFDERVKNGSLRHVGLGESLHFVARALGFELERWSETIAPVPAERELACALGKIPRGHAAGVRQVAEGFAGGERVIALEFQAAIGQSDPHDRVVLDGEPPIDIVLRGGVHGDVATSAIVLNSIAPLLASAPGLHTMATIPIPSCADAGQGAERRAGRNGPPPRERLEDVRRSP